MPNIELIERLQAHYREHPPLGEYGEFLWGWDRCIHGILANWIGGNAHTSSHTFVAKQLGISDHLAWELTYMPDSPKAVQALLERAKQSMDVKHCAEPSND